MIAQKQLKHASIQTTLNLYTHVVDASHRKAVEAVEELPQEQGSFRPNRIERSRMGRSTLYERYRATRSARKDLEKLGDEGAQIFEAIARRNHNDYRDVERRQVLLVRQVPVAGQKNVEVRSSHREQLPVGLASPPHLGSGFDVVTDELALQAPGKALVKQDAHGRGAPPWPAPEPLRPAPW